MTTRPGNAALQHLRKTRGQRICNLIEIRKRNGEFLRFTDHDRTLTFEGHQYRPVSFAAMSARRVEAGLKTGDQDAYGIIDGAYVVVPDLLGNRYRGAEVRHIQADWSKPWLVFGRHRKWIRAVNWAGSNWIATLHARTQELQRDAGGRFGGVFAPTCPYQLGDEHCRADISADVKAGVVVESVEQARTRATFSAATWPGTYVDDYYREGEIEWTVGNNVGHVSPIVSYVHGTRSCQFLLPTSTLR